MEEDQTNVVPLFAAVPNNNEPSGWDLEFVLQLHSVEEARAALARIEMAAELGQRILDRAPQYGEAAALAGVRDVFAALSNT